MPRRLKLPTVELGSLELFLIYQYGQEFEPSWREVQSTPYAALFTVVPKETMDHALHGFTRPLTKSLGLSPQGCLHKIPPENRMCANRVGCSLFDVNGCVPRAKMLPTCYQPEGVTGDVAKQLAFEIVRYWREGVTIVVVIHD